MIRKFDLLWKRMKLNYSLERFYHHRVSQLFQPLHVVPKGAPSKKDELISLSQKLMVDLGIIRARGKGMYAYLPLGQRSLFKLSALIEEEMRKVGGQKLLLPTLTDAHLWKKTGRWESTCEELMKVKDRHDKDYVISPTHEEAIVNLLAEMNPISYKQLSLRLYQISSKFRDEANPRFGLIRCKEFIMKDLYTFDTNEECAISTYKEVSQAYDRIFQRLEVPYVKVTGDCGNIGGSFSHEYHYTANVGQDSLLTCESCGAAVNSELIEDSEPQECLSCGSQMNVTKGIEVGHTFLLGTKYSDPLHCYYLNEKGKPCLLHMGCYGIGLSRVLAASIEALSTENAIKWPWLIAPFKVCIIGPKKGSKEANASSWVDFLAKRINELPQFVDDVITDDRDSLTIGKRVMEAKKTGYPIIVIVGKKAKEPIPQFEVIDSWDETTHNFTQNQLIDFFRLRSKFVS